ncbi:MAG: thiolase family protein [Candidatus Dadabacteria bacterium]|nr:thiolase family protein [Candidatus Dadabacteria bacterium]
MKVAIIGVGQTSYGNKKHQSIDELVFEATKKALDDSGLEREEIESVVTAGSDALDGRGISNMVIAGGSGAYLKDEVKVADGGIYGLILGYLRVASGVFDNSLIVSWTKSSEVSTDLVSNLSFEPLYLRSCGLNSITSLALQTSTYIGRADVKDEDAAKVVLKNRENGLKNPLSHPLQKPSIKEINSSRFVSYPLRESYLPPESDGACALVIASKKRAKSLKKNCAWILGLGWVIDEYYAGDLIVETRHGVSLPLLKRSSEMAYKMAGVENPISEIDVAEVSDVTPYHEMMIYEALGFCRDREGKVLIRDGTTKMGGGLPVNPSGGILSSNPIFTSSLVRVAEGALQVMRKAGKRQVKNAKVALAQGFTGMSTQGSCVVILGS